MPPPPPPLLPEGGLPPAAHLFAQNQPLVYRKPGTGGERIIAKFVLEAHFIYPCAPARPALLGKAFLVVPAGALPVPVSDTYIGPKSQFFFSGSTRPKLRQYRSKPATQRLLPSALLS